MSLQKRFIVSSILMLVVPVLFMVTLTAVMLSAYALDTPVLADMVRSFSRQVAALEGVQSDGAALRLALVWGGFAVVVIAGTCAVVTFYLSRSMLRPIRGVTEAARRISDGDLDFEVLGTDVREIDELCRAFNAMRLRLKESVRLRQDYERERTMLLANISHDLSTPITSIKGYVEGIMDGVADEPERRDRYLHTILAKAQTMETLVEQMYEFSELELGRMQFRFERCDAAEFLRDTLEGQRLDVEAAGVAFKSEIASVRAEVMLDRRRFARVILNVLGNAVKYRGESDPYVLVQAERSEGGIVVSVCDNGVGIAPEDMGKVFEGFYRGDPSRSGKVSGHGLGLAIARQIVESHRGKIWIKSEKGVGTEVNIFLPLAKDEK